ncbi:MAG TPA: hypothetical protein VHF67_06030 [Gaiellaceae bacterium]|jgi:hypothetical protein|nr:hypothetical protein [Gaiellaceae bacterium]
MRPVGKLLRGGLPLILAASAATALPAPAAASEKLTDNASNVALKVDGAGHAVVYFTRNGRRYHPLVWGAVNARHPTRSAPQLSFKIDYSGGYMRLGRPLWKTIRDRCRPYDGPPLPWLVAACKAPDGSYWALQEFRRLLPNLGLEPWRREQRARELHISHWSGGVARLEVWADWVMSERWHEVFGRLTYRGQPVYGFSSTPTGAPLDGYGRLIYLDVYNSALGRGWKRENSFLAGRPNGRFCYMFVPRDRYAGYPRGPRRPAAHGERYRLTAGGPGVTPFVMATVPGLPNYNAANPEHVRLEAQLNPVKASLFGGECFGN